jgi:hypothetical protein
VKKKGQLKVNALSFVGNQQARGIIDQQEKNIRKETGFLLWCKFFSCFFREAGFPPD